MMSELSLQPKSKLLVVELWGIGDLILSSSFLRNASRHYDITLVGKAHASATLRDTFPEIHFIEWNAPWTVFRGKYHFWRWDWRKLFEVLRQLRSLRADVGVSVRRDPRDHFFLWLCGIKRRIGFGIRGSGVFLTESLTLPTDVRHAAEDWADITKLVIADQSRDEDISPRLEHGNRVVERIREQLPQNNRPIVCLHAGARIPVRRWPEKYFSDLIARLRAQYDFSLILVPDPDGYGRGLSSIADRTLENLSVEQLVALISASDLLIANDSAPAHIAAACDCPVIAIFGPTEPRRFRPWGEKSRVVIRDICPYRPCFDYCHFSEPFCLTKLQPEVVWPEIQNQIDAWIKIGVLPRAFRPMSILHSENPVAGAS
jgi:ADP-heptose:LPS heptosyltransferase